jgi:FixJ family two-component response regulator
MPYVAVVDDEEVVRTALKRLLKAAGLEAESYANGEDFLAAQRRPDCVVLDLHMPLMNGQAVLARIRKMNARLPVVIITAHDTPESRAECTTAGAIAYLCKPLDERLLLNAISVALSKSARL